MTTTLEVSQPGKLAGKYLTFVLGDESYGIPVLKVKEIIRLTAVTAVPQMPPHVKGVINLRGQIIPVIDLCIKLGVRPGGTSDSACIVVVQVNGPGGVVIQTGLLVDGVEEVCHFAASDLEATPNFGVDVDTDYVLAMAKSKGRVKALLDIDRIVPAPISGAEHSARSCGPVSPG